MVGALLRVLFTTALKETLLLLLPSPASFTVTVTVAVPFWSGLSCRVAVGLSPSYTTLPVITWGRR
jgi:hypothetical protein